MNHRAPESDCSTIAIKGRHLELDRLSLLFIWLAILLLLCTSSLLAQQNYTPLKSGDYKVVDEDTRYLPGAKIGGSYRAYYDQRKNGFLVGADFESKIMQDITLEFESKINTNVSLHATIENRSSFVTEQEIPYDSNDIAEKGDATGDEGFDLVFGEAYLEYNHNPNARLRVGRQNIDIADRKGLIYKGTATAISQGCRIGTWCYEIGGARIGKSGGSAVFWAQLDYPVYESGVLIKDPWGDKPTRQSKSLNVEIFRVINRGKDIPLADYGGWTGENSVYHDTSDDSPTGSRVYYDNDGIEYIGLNLRWNYGRLAMDMTWSNLVGSRVYHTGTQDGGFSEIGDESVSGNAYHVELSYQFSNEWRARFTTLLATGDDVKTDGEKIWQRESSAYFEIKKGSHGDALIYFNGEDSVGDGHSVSNLTYYALAVDFRTLKGDFGFKTALFVLSHTNPVFVNPVGSDPEQTKAIGNELDVELTWYLEERLSFNLFISYMQPGGAYARNDSLRAEAGQSDFSMIGLDCSYRF